MVKVNMIEEDRLDREISEFNLHLVPFGYGDIKALVETAIDGGHDGRWAAECITDFMEDVGDVKFDDIDPNFVIYDALLREARNDIDNLVTVDILNDTDEQVEVSGNYMCTSLDYSEEARVELVNIVGKIPVEDETDAITWLIDEVDIRDAVNTERKNIEKEDDE